ncbi:type I restriction-modification system subunit M/S [Streptomyces hoynatensis]|uniref:site-specific DNA-methyltransferase (adenine-specific) n=1 Tax=Streptomyces hoynatensis TaxID=1141874 RepID=A0A3A9YM77_9ACTN|nr:type I restriction-modification system subunit M/S [Streptomyces hoynatensis]RKN37488.1 restriction endonuclease subunit M/S [Streptomyces hoynatensis]
METESQAAHAAHVVDRLWRAYAPYQRGRNTSDDVASMLAILVLAGFVESAGESGDTFVTLWRRAVEEARIGLSPLKDLRTALKSAGRHPRFPVRNARYFDAGVLGLDEGPEDAPWMAAFLTALWRPPTVTEAGLPEVCELLLERHAQEGTSSAGEFYTPRAVARLITALASPRPGDRMLDPACGSGSLLAAAAQRTRRAGRVDGDSYEAYATDRGNPRLAMMNLAIHGVEGPVVHAADPVSLFRSRGGSPADRVVSNPPFNQRIEEVDIVRWPFGVPPRSNANFAWLQLAWARLSTDGIAVLIMPPRAAWSEGSEAAIRANMIRNGTLLSIISLPAHLFAHTAIPVHVWVLARDKSHHLPADARRSVLFIDASRLGTRAPRQRNTLTAADVERISGRLHAWRRSPRSTPDEPGFSRSVSHEEILRNEASLDPRLYVDAESAGPRTAPEMSRLLDELIRHDQTASGSSADLWQSLDKCAQLVRDAVGLPRLPLRRIVEGPVGGDADDQTPGEFLAGPSGSLIRAEEYVDSGGIPVVMPKDLTGDDFSTESIRYITEEKAHGLGRYRLRPGDVVLARRGELGRCAVVREEQVGWVCGTGCFVLRPPAWLNAHYLVAYLRGREARTWLEAHSTGSMTMKTISLKVLGELPVALPDLGTQQAIARAMKQLDERERLLREQLALTREIRGGAVHGLFSG